MTFRITWRNVWRSAALAAAIMAVFAVGAFPVRAAEWSISSFTSDIRVHSDASMTVTETISADFAVFKHGIFRNIPFRYDTENGGTIGVPIDITDVTRNGEREPYAVKTAGDEIQVKIGDADKTISGPQTYVITYDVRAVVNFFDAHDELYWNVTGDNWEVPLWDVTASVRLDAAVPAASMQVRCFTGSYGSTEERCETTAADSSATAAADDFLTIVVGWPKGIVAKPADYDTLRANAGRNPLDILSDNPVIFWGFNAILPLLLIGWIVRRWMTHGRDPRGKGTDVVQYDPPPGLTPGEMGTLFDERANHQDVVATIVDLAVRGYLTITEVETKKFIGSAKDYRLDRQMTADVAKLKPHEKKIMDGLFGSADSVTLSGLKGTFHDDVKAVQADLYSQVRDQGYFVSNPSTVRIAYAVGGAALTGLSIFLLAFGLFGMLIAGLVVMIFSPFMPKRTDKGVGALWHARGFRDYLSKAEKYRLQWQEKEHVFEQLLPYAMAFGVADKWSKTFEGIQQAPPSWYHGAPGSHFNSMLLWSSLNSFSTASVRSFAPPAASGSSGFGGGGFSGGGFGGGGGGSW